MMKWILAIILWAGYPAWFVYWIESHNILIFLYCNFGYMAATIIATCWAAGCLPKRKAKP